MSVEINPPFRVFTDVDGEPLEDGFIHIGAVNQNPQAVPISVFWDSALTIPAAQPIRTLGGYPSRTGTPSRMYVAESAYSISVLNKNSTLIYSDLNNTSGDPALRQDLASLTDPAKGSAIVGALSTAIGAVGRTQSSKNADWISILDFDKDAGTGGDDTVAMQAAIAHVLTLRETFNPAVGAVTASAFVNAPALFIPNGRHIRISQELACPPVLFSDGWATIEGTNPAINLFLGDGTYKFAAKNISFVGGLSSVKLQNSNINFGLWFFQNCDFATSSDYAVQALNLSGTYPVTSTQLIFDNCRWRACKRNLKTQCDHSYINGGWQQPDAAFFDNDTAAIHNFGLLTINEVMFIPGGTFGARTRWIDNYGAVRCSQARFGGEGGGIPIVYHFAEPTRYLTGTAESVEMGISFDQCTLYGGGAGRTDSSVVYIQSELPPVVRITDCTGPITRPYILNDPADGGIADITAYISALKTAFSGDDMYLELGYHFRGNKSKFNTATVRWPAALDTYVYLDDGRLVKRASKISTTGSQVITTGTLTRLNLATAVYDPYLLKTTASGADVVRAPSFVRYCKFVGFVEVESHAANNLIYNLRVFINGASVPDAHVNYIHDTAGVIRIQVSGQSAVSGTNDIDLRFIQSSGTDKTVSFASLAVEFD